MQFKLYLCNYTNVKMIMLIIILLLMAHMIIDIEKYRSENQEIIYEI